MTSQLIPVFNGTIDNETTLLVNARDLHTFLGVGKRFASWITERIAEYGFVENQDYIAISQKREIGYGRGKKDYHLTLDTAKELAMVERNEKGRQIRRYFIECEKKLRNIQPVQAESQPQFTAEEIILLCYMQLWMEKAQQLSKQLYPVMRELNSDYYGKLFDLTY
ncbi:antA/AntB antirepressor family protein, partial [Escherichia coli]|nr:antA/AntB antirepressor family protein [Escherichia coli]